MAKVTIQDVAREAGVALGTVSNVLNHPEKVKPATMQLVRDAMDRLGYAPNQSARLLAGGRQRIFGLVLPRLGHGFSLQISSGAEAEALRHGYDLLIANADDDDARSDRYARLFAGMQVAGILVQPLAERDWRPPAAPVTGDANIPIVYLGIQSDEPGWFAAADNGAQGRLIAEHAIERGARHVAVFGKAETIRRAQRAAGIGAVAEDNPSVRFEFLDEGTWDRAHDGYEIGRRLAKRPVDERPDFVIALTDVLATGAITGIQSAGLSVPDDIMVAGGDGNPLAWTGGVSLTTVVPLGYEVGRRGVQSLVEQGEMERRARKTGKPVDRTVNHQALVRPFLLARTSTGVYTRSASDYEMDLGAHL